MSEPLDRINQLIQRLEYLSHQQEAFAKEIYSLRNELYQLKTATNPAPPATAPLPPEKPYHESGFKLMKEQADIGNAPLPQVEVAGTPAVPRKPTVTHLPREKTSLEKFIGENLINKIGIGITVIGVGIGAKYSIEHELISPLTRIILGYLAGLGLLLTGIRLKKKYENYSAVLVSGAMAIMYFITYAAYSFYNIIPQVPAFALMVLFTIFTVLAAISYNNQVIAQIGLVGAYAVPFLLSNGEGKVAILFSYMAIINAGILVIAVKKYWKSLYYSSFAITWIIYGAWYINSYNPNVHFGIGLGFVAIFFTLFYLIFLAYKLVEKEKFAGIDIALLLMNAFIFYGFGYAMLSDNDRGAQMLGLFTVANALIHFIVSAIVYKQKLADRNLFFLIAGLVLVFITIAIPVQLDGNWVTLLWAGEALLLFWIGRAKKVAAYELLSYPIMVLAFGSLLQDWSIVYNNFNQGEGSIEIKPIFNIHFLSSTLFAGAFAGILRLATNKKYEPATNLTIVDIMSLAIPAIFILTVYNSIRLEIESYWQQLFNRSLHASVGNSDFRRFGTIWVINYSFVFLTILSWINIKRIQNRLLGYINLGLNTIVMVIFLVQGSYVLAELRDSYLAANLPASSHPGLMNIAIRYISMALAVLLLYTTGQYIRQDFMRAKLNMFFDLLLHFSLLGMATSELIHLMAMGHSQESYKLGLSILWGMYALLLIVLGIWKKKQYLRAWAIILFGITLLKLFFYDIASLGTIAKTVVFVALGILLLIVSFLYNKYKHIISDEPGK